ncbi:MAG: histidine phosphatase family protein [Bacteroidota bacterium]
MSKKTLFLLRHSYAEGPVGGNDFDRSLTSDGLNTVRALGRYLIKSSFSPSLILCSPSRRTKETVQNLIEELEISEKNVKYQEVLYNASVREMLQEINGLENEVHEAVIVAHNPTITYIAEYLSGETIGNIDPCGLVEIEFPDREWGTFDQSSGKLISYFHPRKLNV